MGTLVGDHGTSTPGSVQPIGIELSFLPAGCDAPRLPVE